MKSGKDSSEVVKFLVSFQRLQDMIGDDPAQLEGRAIEDEALKQLCSDVFFSAWFISMDERKHRRLFATPVDAKFIAMWRRYKDNYEPIVSNVSFSELDLGPSQSSFQKSSRAELDWAFADHEAREQVASIEAAIEFAFEEVTGDQEGFEERFINRIEEGCSAWSRLKGEMGFDLQGIFRRRELVPFVNIPTHVSNRHGESEKLSLLTHLQEAQEAFIFGVHFAALALMRSVLEVTLRVHYRASGKDLNERIENCEALPDNCSRAALHRIRMLANDILHFDSERVRLPKDFEKEILRLLNVLRALIEAAPSFGRR
ncbi:Domain of unknown function DUF4145 [Caulobacteraceae bacterium]